MDSFYKFASENPFLTFFLFAIGGSTIYETVKLFVNRKPTSEKKSKKA